MLVKSWEQVSVESGKYENLHNYRAEKRDWPMFRDMDDNR